MGGRFQGVGNGAGTGASRDGTLSEVAAALSLRDPQLVTLAADKVCQCGEVDPFVRTTGTEILIGSSAVPFPSHS
jgi:hypothetical protein